MRWSTGSIPDAIQASKTQNSVFIVYVFGGDEMSDKMNKIWEENAVTEICEDGKCVSVKISANSPECGFFSQIYPVVVVPSIYLIGENGVPLDVIGGAVEKEELMKKLTNVIQSHRQQTGSRNRNPLQVEPDDQPARLETTIVPESPDISMEQIEVSQTAPVTDRARSGNTDPAVSSGIHEIQPARSQPETSSVSDKIEKVKDFIEQKKEERAEKEKEDERRQEVERRKLGRDVQKLQHFQEDTKQKELVEQMRKEKEEEKKAREKIREQIARDREERAAKYKREKVEKDKLMDETKKARLEEEQRVLAAENAQKCETVRIQFRLADGSSLTQQFPSAESFQTVHSYITEKVGGSVQLSTVYPKRTFKNEDLSETLLSLQLAPSAVIMVLPGTGTRAIRSDGISEGGNNLLKLIMAPFLVIWNFIYTFIFGNPSSPRIQNSPPSDTTQDASHTDSSSFQRRTDRPATAFKRRTPASNQENRSQDGNVRRFRNVQDDDDENATWNGNSTQQM